MIFTTDFALLRISVLSLSCRVLETFMQDIFFSPFRCNIHFRLSIAIHVCSDFAYPSHHTVIVLHGRS